MFIFTDPIYSKRDIFSFLYLAGISLHEIEKALSTEISLENVEEKDDR